MPRLPSTQAHEAVLSAALKLITSGGIEGTSVDDIADASGVSKATIYKHWTDKDALCLEAISHLKCEVPTFVSKDPRAGITEIVRHVARSQKRDALGRIWPRVMSYAAGNPAFARAFAARISKGQRAQMTALLERAISMGELCAGLDFDLAMDMLIGPILHRRFMQAAVPPGLPKRVVDVFWRANILRRRRSRRLSRMGQIVRMEDLPCSLDKGTVLLRRGASQ